MEDYLPRQMAVRECRNGLDIYRLILILNKAATTQKNLLRILLSILHSSCILHILTVKDVSMEAEH